MKSGPLIKMNFDDSVSVKKLLVELESLTSKMDVPVFRRRSVLWLNKNLAKKNQNHPNFKEAQAIVDRLNKMGVKS
jgi:hypothetical protein